MTQRSTGKTRTLAIDFGAGTQDILIFDSSEKIENAVKLIYPSPTKRLSHQVKCANKDLFVTGHTIGGGPVARALKQHLADGFNVFITPQAAYTVRDDLEIVRSFGFTIVEAVLNPDIVLEEFDLNLIESLNTGVGDDTPIDYYLFAAQDHGAVAGQSDRVTRFNFLIPFVEKGLMNAFFDQTDTIPEQFSRWNSLKKEIKSKGIESYCITDTAMVAALGALHGIDQRPIVTIDAGNGHTFAALIGENDQVLGFFEHHTTMMDKTSIWRWLDKLIRGTLTFEEIFDDGGHGAHIYTSSSFDSTVVKIVVTGPNRSYLFDESDERVIFAAPTGDMMITGPIGMLLQQNICF